MKKIIRLTESDLNRIVKRTLREMDENDYTADDAMDEIDSYIQMVGCSEGRSRLLDDLSRMVDEAERELSEEEFDKLSDYVYDLEQYIYETCTDEDEDEEESLYESDITRIVNKVIKESKYRAKFENQKDNYWIDDRDNYVTYDPDLESTGYYDFDYEPYTTVDKYEDIPDDIRDRVFGKNDGKTFYDVYTKRDGKFQYSRKKDFKKT